MDERVRVQRLMAVLIAIKLFVEEVECRCIFVSFVFIFVGFDARERQ